MYLREREYDWAREPDDVHREKFGRGLWSADRYLRVYLNKRERLCEYPLAHEFKKFVLPTLNSLHLLTLSLPQKRRMEIILQYKRGEKKQYFRYSPLQTNMSLTFQY